MKPFMPLIALFLSAYSIAAQSENYPKVWFGGGNICTDAPWQLVFSDDFEGDSLDRSKWMTWYPYGENSSDQCSFCRTHGDEGQIYRDENVEVKNGLLRLTARKEAGTWYDLPGNTVPEWCIPGSRFRTMPGTKSGAKFRRVKGSGRPFGCSAGAPK